MSNEVPTKLSSAVKKAEKNTEEIENIKKKTEDLNNKINTFMNKTEPLYNELNKRFTAINKLEEVLQYLKSYEYIEELRFV